MTKSTICHTKRTDHISTNNSNVKLIRSTFLFSGHARMKNTDSRVFDPAAIDTSAICHVKLHSSAGRFMRYTTDTSHRPNGWPRFNADPIVKHEEFRGTCAPRASTCTNCSCGCGCGCPDLPDLRIKTTSIFLSEPSSPSLSNYIILSIESLLVTVCLI